VTNGSGEYAFPSLPPGVYSVKAEKTGFKTTVRNQIEIQVQQNARLDFELPVLSEYGDTWRRWIDTALDPPRDIVEWTAAPPVPGPNYQAGPRSVVVLIAGLRLPDDRAQ
jgi:hypothetical protein